MRNRIVVGFGLAAICAIAYGVETTTNRAGSESAPSGMGEFAGMSAEAREKRVDDLLWSRSRLQGKLAQELNSEDKGVQLSAVLLLGYYRMEDTVPALSRMILLEYERPGIRDDKLPRYGRYPVVDALVRIGNPAVPEMMRLIVTTEDAQTRKLAAYVVQRVEGPEAGAFVIQNAIDKETDATKKEKLKLALEDLRALK